MRQINELRNKLSQMNITGSLRAVTAAPKLVSGIDDAHCVTQPQPCNLSILHWSGPSQGAGARLQRIVVGDGAHRSRTLYIDDGDDSHGCADQRPLESGAGHPEQRFCRASGQRKEWSRDTDRTDSDAILFVLLAAATGFVTVGSGVARCCQLPDVSGHFGPAHRRAVAADVCR